MKTLYVLILVVLFAGMGCESTSWEYDRSDLVMRDDPDNMWQHYRWSDDEYVVPTHEQPAPVYPAKHVLLIGFHGDSGWVERDLGYAETASKAKIIIRRDLGAKW